MLSLGHMLHHGWVLLPRILVVYLGECVKKKKRASSVDV